ncbi:MAG: ribosomal protein S18-alanine N-acetyltransferase [Aeromonas sp.]
MSSVCLPAAELRPLTLADETAIYAIECAAHPEPWSLTNLRSCFGPRYVNQGLWRDGQLIGFYLSDLVAGDSSLMNIAIAPHAQGQGFGRQLLDAYLACSQAKGAQAWFLEVRASNARAMALYEQAGFAEYCRRTNYYGQGSAREDAILMSRLFAD